MDEQPVCLQLEEGDDLAAVACELKIESLMSTQPFPTFISMGRESQSGTKLIFMRPRRRIRALCSGVLNDYIRLDMVLESLQAPR